MRSLVPRRSLFAPVPDARHRCDIHVYELAIAAKAKCPPMPPMQLLPEDRIPAHRRRRLWDGRVCRIIRASLCRDFRTATSRAGVTESVDVAVSNTAAARRGDSTSPPGTTKTRAAFQTEGRFCFCSLRPSWDTLGAPGRKYPQHSLVGSLRLPGWALCWRHAGRHICAGWRIGCHFWGLNVPRVSRDALQLGWKPLQS